MTVKERIWYVFGILVMTGIMMAMNVAVYAIVIYLYHAMAP